MVMHCPVPFPLPICGDHICRACLVWWIHQKAWDSALQSGYSIVLDLCSLLFIIVCDMQNMIDIIKEWDYNSKLQQNSHP